MKIHAIQTGTVAVKTRQVDAAHLTHRRIRELAAATPTVYLVAHDPGSAARLAERRVVGRRG